MSACRRSAGRLFQSLGPAAAKQEAALPCATTSSNRMNARKTKQKFVAKNLESASRLNMFTHPYVFVANVFYK